MKQTFYIKSEIIVEPASSNILLIAGTSYCCFGIVDHITNELVEFGYYIREANDGGIVSFIEENPSFRQRYYQAFISFDTEESILVPASLYRADDSQLQLQALFGNAVRTSVVAEQVPAWGLVNIYRLPSDMQASVSMKFSNSNYCHLRTVMLKNFRSGDADYIFVEFKPGDFSAIVYKENRLILAQTFNYKSAEDVLYNLLKICQQLDISQQSVLLKVSGLIEKDSALYSELNKYFIDLQFDDLYGDLTLCAALQHFPLHYFSTISKLTACVS